jgi:hypothetical protein
MEGCSPFILFPIYCIHVQPLHYITVYVHNTLYYEYYLHLKWEAIKSLFISVCDKFYKKYLILCHLMYVNVSTMYVCTFVCCHKTLLLSDNIKHQTALTYLLMHNFCDYKRVCVCLLLEVTEEENLGKTLKLLSMKSSRYFLLLFWLFSVICCRIQETGR